MTTGHGPTLQKAAVLSFLSALSCSHHARKGQCCCCCLLLFFPKGYHKAYICREKCTPAISAFLSFFLSFTDAVN